MTDQTTTCCPRFDPQPWDEQEIEWENKQFVKDRVRSIFHIPLNFGSVMKRNVAQIKAANAKPDNRIVLSDENSLWGADVYLCVAKEVPNAKMTTITGKFLSRAFEGPYRDIPKWIKEMTAYVESKGKTLKKLYFYYTTCLRCAKKYGQNYVVLLAQV